MSEWQPIETAPKDGRVILYADKVKGGPRMRPLQEEPAGGRASGELRSLVLAGRVVTGICGHRSARAWGRRVMGDLSHEIWYTERNGDPIAAIAPAGTTREQMPSSAQGYIVLEWIRPEAEFSDRGCAHPK